MSSSKSNTRTRILEATRTLLEAGQGGSVRMSDIAGRAGITRQALYLHFATRAELLVATTFHVDELLESDKRLAPSRAARTGIERLDAFIEAWGGYIPEIHGIAKALLAMKDSDEAAAAAWNQRMQDMREGCEAAIKALDRDGILSSSHSEQEATDILWTLLSVRNWEQLTLECGWSQQDYVDRVKALARRIFVAEDATRRHAQK